MAQTQPNPLTPRGQFWLKHIEQWELIQTSQAQYCRDQNISVPAFGWWKRKLAKEGYLKQEHSSSQRRVNSQVPFTEITLPPVNHPQRVSQMGIQLPNRVVLTCDHHVDRNQLEQVLQVLVNLC